MADRRVFARLRITPCGLFDSSAHTITLEQIDGAFLLRSSSETCGRESSHGDVWRSAR